jgi:hypothetical protein
MRRLILLLMALVVLGGLGFWPATETNQKIKRAPLQKPGTPLKSPASYEKRERVQSGKQVTYDPKPRVQVVDGKAGKYELRWIGYDGREKVIAYQHPDSIDVVVSGSVDESADGNYVYSYIVDILPSSATYLYAFDLQNFSDDAYPVEINGKPTALADLRILKNFSQRPDDGKPRNFETTIVIGRMSNLIHRFREGTWIAFGILPDFEPQVSPGGRLLVKVVSKAAPGLVGCSAVAGPRTMKGVGEHMPSELEDVIPGYEAWPSGHTVGPVEFLNSLTQGQRVTYILDKMPQFEKLGWITSSAREWYEKNFAKDVVSAQNRAQKDLKSEQISSEVFAMIQAVK